MTVEITLNLPENLVEQAQRFGQITKQDVGYILADTLEMYAYVLLRWRGHQIPNPYQHPQP